jgi:hypothetical protein
MVCGFHDLLELCSSGLLLCLFFCVPNHSHSFWVDGVEVWGRGTWYATYE